MPADTCDGENVLGDGKVIAREDAAVTPSVYRSNISILNVYFIYCYNKGTFTVLKFCTNPHCIAFL